MPFKLGEIVIVVGHQHNSLDHHDGNVGVIVGHPKPVAYEGYPFEVLLNGKILRVHREQLYRFETIEALRRHT
jgi:hypothetical protein